MGKQGKKTKFTREKGERDRPENEEDFRKRALLENGIEGGGEDGEEKPEDEEEVEEVEEKRERKPKKWEIQLQKQAEDEEKKEEEAKKPKKGKKPEEGEKKVEEEKKPKKGKKAKEEEEGEKKEEEEEKKPKKAKKAKEENKESKQEKKIEKEQPKEEEKKEEEPKEPEEEWEIRVEKVERDAKVKVIPNYCGVCGWPIEFCEFSNKWDQCKEWLEKNHPKVCEELCALREQDKTKDKKIKQKPTGDKPKPLTGVEEIIITVQPRQKKKYITSVEGLAAFGINLKDLSKKLAKKYASGCSPFKRDDGVEGIEIQGSMRDKIFGVLLKEYKIDQTKIFYMEITKDEEGKVHKNKKPMRLLPPKNKKQADSDSESGSDDDDDDDDEE